MISRRSSARPSNRAARQSETSRHQRAISATSPSPSRSTVEQASRACAAARLSRISGSRADQRPSAQAANGDRRDTLNVWFIRNNVWLGFPPFPFPFPKFSGSDSSQRQRPGTASRDSNQSSAAAISCLGRIAHGHLRVVHGVNGHSWQGGRCQGRHAAGQRPANP